MNLKKKVLLGVLSLAALSAGTAQATTIGFDPDASGDPQLVDVFQWDTIGAYVITTDLGADNTLNDGDTFTETFRMGLLTTEQPAGSATVGYSLGGLPQQSFVYFDISLQGFINNYSDGGDGPTTGADPSGIGNDIFDIVFTGGTFNIFYDPDQSSGSANVANDVNIASLLFAAGGADNFSFQNATATADLGLTLLFDTIAAGVWFDSDLVTDLQAAVDKDLVLALGDSSVDLEGVSSNGTDLLFLTVSDNGTTMRVAVVPGPAPLALLGVGLLAGVWTSRRKAKLS